ncbi:DNA helicase PIF1, ATP-dependent [Corchorus capsularis]|uniref:ATP-dependent DNA helicase n=1 Tax=Corchorus capsularis TaxID=210143 RepID=A0A1R3J1V6_COCAP|nr:DNA helicase PIF1, ATP-dependent [Corchorus capsularis]
MKDCLCGLINPVQAVFLPRRKASDNIILVQEAMNSARNSLSKDGWMVVKIDLEKAFDSAIEVADSLARRLGYRKTLYLGTYLGHLILDRKGKKCDFIGVIDKIRIRVTGWKAQHLSLAETDFVATTVAKASGHSTFGNAKQVAHDVGLSALTEVSRFEITVLPSSEIAVVDLSEILPDVGCYVSYFIVFVINVSGCISLASSSIVPHHGERMQIALPENPLLHPDADRANRLNRKLKRSLGALSSTSFNQPRKDVVQPWAKRKLTFTLADQTLATHPPLNSVSNVDSYSRDAAKVNKSNRMTYLRNRQSRMQHDQSVQCSESSERSNPGDILLDPLLPSAFESGAPHISGVPSLGTHDTFGMVPAPFVHRGSCLTNPHVSNAHLIVDKSSHSSFTYANTSVPVPGPSSENTDGGTKCSATIPTPPIIDNFNVYNQILSLGSNQRRNDVVQPRAKRKLIFTTDDQTLPEHPPLDFVYDVDSHSRDDAKVNRSRRVSYLKNRQSRMQHDESVQCFDSCESSYIDDILLDPLLLPEVESGAPYISDVPSLETYDTLEMVPAPFVQTKTYETLEMVPAPFVQIEICHLLPAFSSIDLGRIIYDKDHESELRSEMYSNVRDVVARGDVQGNDIGKRIILPASYTWGPRYMYQNYQDAMVICRYFGYPSLFITFTCNPKWDEIQQALNEIPGQRPEDRPDMVYRVFRLKVRDLIRDLIDGKHFGTAIADPSTKWSSTDEIDEMLSAELPHPQEDLVSYDAVSTCPDRARISVQQSDQPSTSGEAPSEVVVDEIKMYLDCRYVSAHEACWHIFEFDIHFPDPAVQRLLIHLPNQQNVFFYDRQHLQDFLGRPDVVNPTKFFETNWKLMSDDIQHAFRQNLRASHFTLDDADLRSYVFVALEDLLHRNASSLQEVNLPLPRPNDRDIIEDRLIQQELDYDRDELQHQHAIMVAGRTNEQKRIYDEVLNSVLGNEPKLFFVYGYGGTGKTYLWNTIIAALRCRSMIVIVVASSGIASLLLPGERTAHSRFKIPIEINERSTCQIKKGTQLAKLMKKASLIIWDEAPMIHMHCLEALKKTLSDILFDGSDASTHGLFGGKTLFMGGDFRQILPVIPQGSKTDIVSASICNSSLWQHFRIFTLTTNMRLNRENLDPHKKKGLQQFAMCWRSNLVCFRKERAIVTPYYETVDQINQYALNLIPGESVAYLSSDALCKSSGGTVDNNLVHSPELLNSLRLPGIPNHELNLKVCCVVMLLRKVNQAAGLCNGRRLVITQMAQNVVEGKFLGEGDNREKVFIPRITFTMKDKKWAFDINRRQFPLRLSYAMSINKSQGQTLKKVGLYLPRPVFSHGQLYVALSRVTSFRGLKILIHDEHGNASNITKNVVYKDIFESLPSNMPYCSIPTCKPLIRYITAYEVLISFSDYGTMGNAIHDYMEPGLDSEFEGLLCEGMLYKIENFEVKGQKPTHNAVSSNNTIVLNWSTVVTKTNQDVSGFPQFHFEFPTMDQIIARESSDRLMTASKIKLKNKDEEVEKRTIQLRLLSGDEIKVSIWAKFLANIDMDSLAMQQPKPVLIVAGTTVKKVDEGLGLTTTTGMKILVDFEIAETAEIR